MAAAPDPAKAGVKNDGDPTQPGPADLTLDEALRETLQSDPKLRAALEGIEQARADLLTSSLPPNPTLAVNGVFIPARRFTPTAPGGPPELDVVASYPIDWFLFGKRAAAMANAQWGVEVSTADYCDQVRQRMANAAAAFYDVLEAQAMLGLPQEDLASLKRVDAITRQRARIGGVGTIEVDRLVLSVLDAERDVRTREATLVTNKAQFRAAMGRGINSPVPRPVGDLAVPAPAGAVAGAAGHCPGRGEPAGHHLAAEPDCQGPQRHRGREEQGLPVDHAVVRLAKPVPGRRWLSRRPVVHGDVQRRACRCSTAIRATLRRRNRR